LNDLIKIVGETDRSSANLLGVDWSRRCRSRYRTVFVVATGGGHTEHRFD